MLFSRSVVSSSLAGLSRPHLLHRCSRPYIHRTLSARPLSFTKRQFSISSTMSKQNLDPESASAISSLISFWFSFSPQTWFTASDDLDSEIRSRFSTLISSARSGALDHWASTPEGALSLVLLLDQFPRNIFRNSGESFSSDAKALEIATQAVAQGFDKELGAKSKMQQTILYMPFMHAESLLAQVASVSLFESLSLSSDETITDEEAEQLKRSLEFAKTHLNCVAKLGRFPKRNEAIGRASTAEEKAFLEEHPAGF